MLTVDVKIKEFFFDRLKVTAAVDKDRLRFLRNAGGFARRTARNSMKRRGKARTPPKNMNGRAYRKWLDEIENQPSSPPGKPPYTHSDSPVTTLKNILFAFGGKDNVIVGPVGLNGQRGQVPALHEYGGSQLINEKLVSFSEGKGTSRTSGRRWVPIGKRGARPGQPTRRRTAKYPARPFMGPAVKKTEGKFKNLWFTNASALRGAG